MKIPASVVVILLFAGTTYAKDQDVCLEWFARSGLSAKSKDCVLRCDILPKDMSTFTCADRCDEFCKPLKCTPDPYWKDKVKSGRPDKWDIPAETTTEWTEGEKKKLLTLLSRLPEEFKSIPFDGFYRMKKSVDIINPATTASDGRSIAVYDRAFANPFFSTSRVIVHELAHAIHLHLKKSEWRDYQTVLKWKKLENGSFSRPGKFVSSRAKDSVEEDFAENIDAFMFEPERCRSGSLPMDFKKVPQELPTQSWM